MSVMLLFIIGLHVKSNILDHIIGSVLRILPVLSITCSAETHKLALHPFFFLIDKPLYITWISSNVIFFIYIYIYIYIYI